MKNLRPNINENQIVIKSIILFFLSYVFGVTFHNIIHEFGHAFAIWMQGGSMTGFYFHPFNGGLNSSTYVPNHLLLYAGGAFLGLPLTILFMLIALKYKSPIMFPLILTGTYGFFTTGIWMLKSVFLSVNGVDYTYMIDLGTPRFLMLIIGISYISFGIFSRIFFLPLAGINYRINYKKRFAVYIFGITPWFVLHGVFNIIFHNSSVIFIAYLLLAEIFYATVEVLISLPLQRKVKIFKHIPYQKITFNHFITIGVAIILIYAFMIFVNTFFPIKT